MLGAAFLPYVIATLGALAWGEHKRKQQSNKDATAMNAANASGDKSAKEKITNVYNYNGLNNSNMGRTLFNTGSTEQNPLQKRGLFQ